MACGRSVHIDHQDGPRESEMPKHLGGEGTPTPARNKNLSEKNKNVKIEEKKSTNFTEKSFLAETRN